MTTKEARPRGRPRQFDADEAVAVAQGLFHARGYDRVGVEEISMLLGIRPPSFYAAFGSKMGLYQRVLERYGSTDAIPLTQLLRPDAPVAECLAAVLEEAARRYAAHPAATGCLVLEGTHCTDEDARKAACDARAAAEHVIYGYIAERHPEHAEQLTDFVSTTMSGLSAKARSGQSVERLLATARLGGAAIAQLLDGDGAAGAKHPAAGEGKPVRRPKRGGAGA